MTVFVTYVVLGKVSNRCVIMAAAVSRSLSGGRADNGRSALVICRQIDERAALERDGRSLDEPKREGRRGGVSDPIASEGRAAQSDWEAKDPEGSSGPPIVPPASPFGPQSAAVDKASSVQGGGH